MKTCVIAGGVGSARLLAGLTRVVDPADLTVVGNTGDDERIRGLHICPDIDTVLYHLAGATDWQRGWGLDDETFRSNDRYRELVAMAGEPGVDMQEWFSLGDTDLATHQFRARLLDAGRTLSEATDALRRALGIAVPVLPMSDDPVRTMLETTSGERLDFQTYFVRRGHADAIAKVTFEGADDARPAPGVLDAISGADLVLIPPSNPIVTVAPVLAVPGIRDALRSAGRRVAVSPIVGGHTVKGPADALLASLGHDISCVGVGRIYEGLVDVFVIDEKDATLAAEIEAVGMKAVVLDTIMDGPESSARLAKEILDHVG